MNPAVLGTTITQWLLDYVFYFPFLMAYVWMGGGIAHALVFERDRRKRSGDRRQRIDPIPLLPSTPLVSVVVPCFNESASVRRVIEQLMRSRYPDFEVIAVDDGSTDDTAQILEELALEYPLLRVIYHAGNQGKAVALNSAAMLAKGEFILGIDGDALVDPDAIAWMLRHMLVADNVGAVTGNPRIRTRTSLIGRMQVGEFSSTIGLIKRTQHLFGRLFTVSGVIAMFRRQALIECKFWSTDVMTEDIEVSWKLQLAGWTLRFEPRALCWILMPETIVGLYRQRQRWAIGGVQTLLRHSKDVFKWRNFAMFPIYLEYLASVVWAYAMFLVLALAAFRPLLPDTWVYIGFLPQWHGMLLGITCMLQMLVSLWIDRHYDRSLLRYFAWTIWYPVAFWMINMLTTVLALPIVLARRRGERGVWESPDRGVTDVE